VTPTPHLSTDVDTLQHLVREQFATIAELRAEIRQQQDRIDWLTRMHFGRRSERVEGPTLFDAFPPPEPVAVPEPPPVETVVVEKKKGHGRRPGPQNLPHVRQELKLTAAELACPCCSELRVRIGEEVTSRLDYQPASLFYRDIVRPTHICRRCEQNGDDVHAVQPPLPPEPIVKGTCAPGLLAHVIVSKYVDHLPLYRLESILGRLGWKVSRSTLCGQVMACASVLEPLYELMCQRVRQSLALYADDTSLTLLKPLRTAYAWVYVGDLSNPYTVFELTEARLHEFPEKFLHGYQGYLHADGYTGYNPIYAGGATHVGCWMHVRRYFFEAKANDPIIAHEALARIRALYQVEQEAKDLGAKRMQPLTAAELADHRQTRAGPLLANFADWLAAQVPRAIPKSKIGEAITYASNQWPTLMKYIRDGRLSIDNGPAEQAIRPLAVGRRNWLHIAGDGGLKSAAVMLSIAASAKRLAINPWDYFKHLLTELPARGPGANLEDLLPNLWAKPAPTTI
jgi:transposase